MQANASLFDTLPQLDAWYDRPGQVADTNAPPPRKWVVRFDPDPTFYDSCFSSLSYSSVDSAQDAHPTQHADNQHKHARNKQRALRKKVSSLFHWVGKLH